jgi:hypothetical protein
MRALPDLKALIILGAENGNHPIVTGSLFAKVQTVSDRERSDSIALHSR